MASKEIRYPKHVSELSPALLSLLTDCSKENTFLTVTQDHFKPPLRRKLPYERRKEYLRKFYWHQFAQQCFNEVDQVDDESMANAISTYRDMFDAEGFQITNPLDLADSEMFAKYPLYSDPARSIYYEKLAQIKGKSVNADPLAAFRKNSYFSRPWYSELE